MALRCGLTNSLLAVLGRQDLGAPLLAPLGTCIRWLSAAPVTLESSSDGPGPPCSDGSAAGGGLFGIRGLHEPKDFARMTQETRARCDDLLARVSQSPPDASIVQLMDDLSDTLCQTYDAAECCRNVHTDPAWVRAASQACTVLGEYISEVNHDTRLYSKLSASIQRYRQYEQERGGGPHDSQRPAGSATAAPASDAASSSSSAAMAGGAWAAKARYGARQSAVQQASQRYAPLTAAEAARYDAETVLVGSKLLMDMEKAGIHLDAGPRARMQTLMNLNQHYAMAFNAALGDPKQLGSVTVERPASASGARPAVSGGIFARLASRGQEGRQQSVTVPLDTPTMNHVLLTEPDEAIRKAVFLAGQASPLSNLRLLDEILSTRREMAETVGCPSYSDYKAVDASLAQESQAIVGFLQDVATSIRPAADAELEVLKRLKGSSVQAWDVEFLMARARADACALPSRELAEYLTLPSVLDGFAQLMQRVFGLSFQVVPAPASEAWAPGILKMTATHPDHGPLGTVYLDLCSRPGKYPGAVTFPIRCGRALPGPQPSYQLPIMALLADFGSSHPDRICLSYRDLRTLLHELGHCCHNLASRTRYQHLWGTRCAQDMVEVPSHLWEHFAVEPATLRLLARHRGATRDPLPDEVGRRLVGARRIFSALELQGQLVLAMVDQVYHGTAAEAAAAAAAGINGGGLGAQAASLQGLPATSAIWQHVAGRYSSVPHAQGTHPQARVSHLTVYGASYYSYVYARLLSAAVWNRHLEGAALGAGAGSGGRAVWEGLLRPGGSIEPLGLLRGLLGPGALQQSGLGGWAPKPDEKTVRGALSSF